MKKARGDTSDADRGWDDSLIRVVRQDADAQAEWSEPIINAGPRIGRNDPCPCGSGKKYRKCCMRK